MLLVRLQGMEEKMPQMKSIYEFEPRILFCAVKSMLYTRPQICPLSKRKILFVF